MDGEILVTGKHGPGYVLHPPHTVASVKAGVEAAARRRWLHVHWYRRIGDVFSDLERDMGLTTISVCTGGSGLGRCRCGAVKPMGTR